MEFIQIHLNIPALYLNVQIVEYFIDLDKSFLSVHMKKLDKMRKKILEHIFCSSSKIKKDGFYR